jgi:small subunit ribosomal protein S1
MPEPWSVVHEQYAIGQLVDAEITRLTSFGAFARVDGKLEGLIHISEISDQRINHPKEVVHEGQKLMLRVIKIDPDKRRMGLSLKRAGEDSYAVMDWAAEETDDLMEEDQTSMAAAMADAEMAADAELEAGAGSKAEAELEADAEMMVDAGSMAEAELEADAEMMVDAEAEEASVV